MYKFSEFINENNKSVQPKTDNIPVQKIAKNNPPVIKEPEIDKTGNVKTPKTPEIKEQFNFDGKIVEMPSKIKPSVSIVILENNKISKDKLHYIISKQTNDTLVVLKYNEKAEIKLTEFVNTLITFYSKNENLKNLFDKIVVEGNDSFSIMKNIPNVNLGEKSLMETLSENLIKLLK